MMTAAERARRNKNVYTINSITRVKNCIDDSNIVWHGGMNLLGRDDAWDNLMRIKSKKVAAELLEIAFKHQK